MKRTVGLTLAGVAAVAVFAGLVHAVLVGTHLSEPTGTTVYGLTSRRMWASAAAVLGLAGVIVGAVGRLPAITLVLGLAAVVNGGLVLAVADGGPGSGNGVVGAAAAVVLGLIAMVVGGVALARAGAGWAGRAG